MSHYFYCTCFENHHFQFYCNAAMSTEICFMTTYTQLTQPRRLVFYRKLYAVKQLCGHTHTCLVVWAHAYCCVGTRVLLCGHTRLVVWAHASCCVGTRVLLCGHTRLVVWAHASCVGTRVLLCGHTRLVVWAHASSCNCFDVAIC